MSTKGAIAFGVILSAVLAFGLWGALRDNADRERLLKQCLDDGKKEYQCRAVVR